MKLINKILIPIILSIVSVSVLAQQNAKEYFYEKTIQLQGIKKVGPDGFPYLYLEQPIVVKLAPGATDEMGLYETETIQKLQIAVDGVKLKKGADIPNSCVILTGKLFHADNANHKTNVLVDTKDFKKCD